MWYPYVYSTITDSNNADSVLHLATKLSTDAWKGKKVVLFAVPGAFTVSPDPPPCRQFRN